NLFPHLAASRNNSRYSHKQLETWNLGGDSVTLE
ncbi:hypothetical protein chiPu_0020874, partial [Chiloscyllium punctatum]|nr:hypothetical protein [Chiloscyllium punctatum]